MTSNQLHPGDSLNITAITKGRERYILVWPDAQRSEALRTVLRWALDDDLSFDIRDAVAVAERIDAMEAPKVRPRWERVLDVVLVGTAAVVAIVALILN